MNDKASPSVPLVVEFAPDGQISVKFPEKLSEEEFELSFSYVNFLHGVMCFVETILGKIEVQGSNEPTQILIRVPVNDSLRQILKCTKRRAILLSNFFFEEKKEGNLPN